MLRTTRLAALAALPLTALALVAAAQAAKPARFDASDTLLANADSNGDGRISLDEFLAAAAARFSAIDAQNKGRFDAADLATSPAAEQRIAERADAVIKRLDTAGNGYVTQDEFVAGARDRFAHLDKNGDGRLTPDELERHRGGKAHKHADAGAAGNQDHFARLDVDHDGSVTLAEYLAAASAKFKQLDTAKTGKLTAAQIEASPRVQDRAIRVADRMVAHMDSNGDGVVDKAEFMAAARKRFERMDANADGYLEGAELSNPHGNHAAHTGRPG